MTDKLVARIVVVLFLIGFAVSTASAERLWVVPEESKQGTRIAIDTDSLRFSPSSEGPYVFVEVHVAPSSASPYVKLYGTPLAACDNDGGKLLTKLLREGTRPVETLLWSKGGGKMYDIVAWHICDWVRVIIETEGETGITSRLLVKPSAKSGPGA